MRPGPDAIVFERFCGMILLPNRKEASMMMSPECYVAELENATYEELIRERGRLVAELVELEASIASGEEPELLIYPSDDVRYQMCLEYLAALSVLMVERVSEFIGGDEGDCE